MNSGSDLTFRHFRLPNGVRLFLHPNTKYKTITIDIFLRSHLAKGRASQIALIGRLLERGTRRWPDMRAINSFLDDMYGASFAVDVEQAGEQQLLHFSFEVIDGRLIGENGRLMENLFEFVDDVVYHPAGDGGTFEPEYVAQESRSQEIAIRSLYTDKMAYAQRRCVEIMCEHEPYGLSIIGTLDDLSTTDGIVLYQTYRQILQASPMEVFVSGPFEREQTLRLCESTFLHERNGEDTLQVQPMRSGRLSSIDTCESQQLNQGRLAQGYRTGIKVGHRDYPALVLFSALFGGDSYSRLFKSVRETSGLCYAIESRVDPMAGFLFVDAGVEAADVNEAKERIAEELDSMRRQSVTSEEFDRVRCLLMSRVRALGDSRAGLLRLFLQRWIAGADGPRSLEREVASVRREDLSRIAERVLLDTTFFLY